MTISPWAAILLAIPILWVGESLVRRVKFLSRFNIPAPVVGGLLVSLLVLAANLAGRWEVRFGTHVSAAWWTWLVSTGPEWASQPAKAVNLPFLVGFFTCIGLNASWSLARRGSVQVVLFLGAAAVLAVIQNGLGVVLARALSVSPLLGLVCGSVTMTGGHGTALGFAGDLEKAGLQGAAVLGAAAATFGLVAGGLLGGPVGGWLIRKNGLKPSGDTTAHLQLGQSAEPGVLGDLRTLTRLGQSALLHVLLVLVCIKAGAWAGFLIQQTGLTFPVYMGAMLVGVLVRNAVDLAGGWIRTEIVDTIASVALGVFLTGAMMSLNLIELAQAALPMLVILAAQIVVMAAFACLVTFRLMGRDFDAAVMAGGHCGFGLGATPNAVANMKSLVESHGPAPRAFLVVPIVGAFLIDVLNALNITLWMNLAG